MVEIKVSVSAQLRNLSTSTDTVVIILQLVNTVKVEIVVRSYLWVTSNRVSMTIMTMTAVSRASMAEGKLVN